MYNLKNNASYSGFYKPVQMEILYNYFKISQIIEIESPDGRG